MPFPSEDAFVEHITGCLIDYNGQPGRRRRYRINHEMADRLARDAYRMRGLSDRELYGELVGTEGFGFAWLTWITLGIQIAQALLWLIAELRTIQAENGPGSL